MQERLLKDKENTKIYLIYTDGVKQKLEATYRYMDKNHFYLAALTPTNFNKPRKNCPAEIIAYRTEGVYKTTVKIIDVHFSINELVFLVTIPTKWDFAQLRSSSRKQVDLHFSMSFEDGFKIEAEMHDLSLNGFSFVVDSPLTSLYKQVNADLVIDLPQRFKKNQITVQAKYKRDYPITINLSDKFCYVYQFNDLSSEDKEILKILLMSAD